VSSARPRCSCGAPRIGWRPARGGRRVRGRKRTFAPQSPPGGTRAHPASTRPLDYTHVLDLVRRTYDGAAAWGIGLRGGNLETLSADAPDDTVRRRGKSIVELGSVDGREHIVRDQGGVFAAIGDFPYGVGLLLPATVTHDRSPPASTICRT